MYLIDVQGTLLNDIDRQPINGAVDFIDSLNSKSVPYVVVTNNTKKRSEEFYNSLLKLGFKIPKDSYLDPFMVLKSTLHVERVCCFGTKDFVEVVESLGYTNTKENPEAILVTSSKDFGSVDYASMIELVLGGAKLIGMHATSIYAKDGRRYAGVGAIMKMVAYATGCDYEVIGKPSFEFYKKALELLHVDSFEKVNMISDDAIGDLKGIKEMGAKTTLVLSGKCKSEEEILPIKEFIDEVVVDIGRLNG